MNTPTIPSVPAVAPAPAPTAATVPLLPAAPAIATAPAAPFAPGNLANLFATTAEAPNVKQAQAKSNKAKQTSLDIRKVHWPDAKEEDLWELSKEKKRNGFAQVPRTLSMVANMTNDLAKRKHEKAVPVGKTYFVLWLHQFGEGLVRIHSEAQIAYEAGYGGQRNVSTFRLHMEILKALGFIDFRKGVKGPMHYVLLWNPYAVVKRLHGQVDEFGQKLVSDEQYAAFVERTNDIGSRGELAE